MKRIFGVVPLSTQITNETEIRVYTNNNEPYINIGDVVVYDGGDGLYLGTINCYYRCEIGNETTRMIVQKIDTHILEEEHRKRQLKEQMEAIVAQFPNAINIIKEYLEVKDGE